MRIKALDFTRTFFNRFKRNEEGATAIEYGLLVALIAISLMIGLGAVFNSMDAMFKRMDASVAESNTKAGG
jgi:pilus assembly protein Flp/PilA